MPLTGLGSTSCLLRLWLPEPSWPGPVRKPGEKIPQSTFKDRKEDFAEPNPGAIGAAARGGMDQVFVGPGDVPCSQDTHEAGHVGAHVRLLGGRWALQGYLHVHVSPRTSENRDPLLCEPSEAACLPFSSLRQPGPLSPCSEPGLSGCQPVAGGWPEARLPWGRLLLRGQLLLEEVDQLRSLGVGVLWSRWCSRWLIRPTCPLLGHLSPLRVLSGFLPILPLYPFPHVLSDHMWG